MFRCLALTAALLFPPQQATCAQNWPGWRGDGSGVSDAMALPSHWSATENICWQVELPGKGFSSPIIWQDHLFATSAGEGGTRRAVHAVDAASGELRWSREIEHDDPELTSAMTGHAAATPVTDGEHVVAFFGNAGAVCYDFAGRELWRRDLGRFVTELGLASSPRLRDGKVFLVCDHDGDRFKTFDSFLIALDVQTGETVWKTERPKLFRSWSTPLVASLAGGAVELVVNGQEQLRGYDAATGKLLWQVAGMTDWVTPSPLFADGLIYATSGRDGPILAVRPGGRGDVTASHVAWRTRGGAPYVCSPVLYRGHLVVHNEQGIVSCFAADSGQLRYRERLEGKFFASSVAGDGKIFITNDAGTTYVLKAGERFELLAKNSIAAYTLASPAISGGQLYLRNERHLICIGR
jgi:outer membrane protein assembly factor BamB